MTSLRIPEYNIDDRFISSLRADNVAYVHGVLTKQQKWVNSYFFYKIEKEIPVGMMESHIVFPAKFILTPVGYCLMFNCPASMIYLLQRDANPNKNCIIVDCPVMDPALRWKVDLYRLHEVQPFALTYPYTEVYKILTLSDFNPNARCGAQFRLVTNKEDRYRGEVGRGVWEFAWIFWKNMRDMSRVLVITQSLLENGLDATRSLAHLNVSELFKRCFGFKTHFISPIHAENALTFVEILFNHGSMFDKMRISNAAHHCVLLLWTYFNNSEGNPNALKRVENLGLGFYCLSRRFRQNLRRSSTVPAFFKDLLEVDFMTLSCMCIRIIRGMIGSKYFRARLYAYVKDDEGRFMIQRGFAKAQRKERKG